MSAFSNDIGPRSHRHRFSFAIKAASDSAAVVVAGHYVNLLSNPIVGLIGEFSRIPVMHDPPWREGELCFKNTHAMWAQLAQTGHHKMAQVTRKKINAKYGSSFNPCIYDVASKKQNSGVMHTPNGHINHY